MILTAPRLYLFTNRLYCTVCEKKCGFEAINKIVLICGSDARHGKKDCSSYTIKEDFLKEKILCTIRSLVQEIVIKKRIPKSGIRS